MAPPKTVKIIYYAILKEACGCPEEDLQTHAGTTAELYAEIQQRHGLSLDRANLRVAVNAELVSWDASLHDQDEVVFLPPAGGG